MMTVDTRGLSCPQPVMLATKAAKEGEFPFAVLVDTVTARDNVRRAMESAGHKVHTEETGEDYRMTVEA